VDRALDLDSNTIIVAKRGEDLKSYKFRWVCACCGQPVIFCAEDSVKVDPYFKHHSGNDDTECQFYIARITTVSFDKAEKVEDDENFGFYFDSKTNEFSVGLKFNSSQLDERSHLRINKEPNGSNPDSILLSRKNFMPPGNLEKIPLKFFSHNYYINIGEKRLHTPWFRQGDYPTIFKILKSGAIGGNFHAKLIRGETLFTSTKYIAFAQNSSIPPEALISSSIDIDIENKFTFKS